MTYAESWHVRSRSRYCAVTERGFADGEIIITALYPDPESSGYLRRDYCEDAWGQLSQDSASPFSFWKSTYRIAEPDPREHPEEKISPEELLRRLVNEDDSATENTRYILAVMLERQKLLRETDTQRLPVGLLRVYEHRKTGEVFIIRDPDIPLEQVEKVQDEVMMMLDNNAGNAADTDVEHAVEENEAAAVEPS